VKKLVQLVSQLLAENQQRALVSGSHDALTVSPDDLADLSIVDPYPWWSAVFTLLVPTEIEDRLRQFPRTLGVEIGAQHDRAVEGSGFLPSAARDGLAGAHDSQPSAKSWDKSRDNQKG
jgi:hypothetical protein